MIFLYYIYDHDLDLHKLNKSCICLIAKEKDATLIKKFRSISLVNCTFKIISKLLTIRMDQIMPKLIDLRESVFLKNIYILDNMILS